MEKIRSCRDCGNDFDSSDPTHKNFGFIDQCRACAKDVKRYIGRVSGETKTGSGIEIFRSDAEINTVGPILRRESSCGFNANLSFNSPSSGWATVDEDSDGYASKKEEILSNRKRR
jgi:hypothetical protein